MIKVNLLDSVTDKTNGSLNAVEARVASPGVQSKLLLLVVASLLVAGMGLDWMTARSSHAAAQTELAHQQEVAQQMAAIKREQDDLRKKTADVQVRIDAIQKLRASQRGPVSVLSSINERLPPLPDFRLGSIEQKDETLTITGDSPNEAAVTQFGRSLEFSSGLFSNVNIETQRKAMDNVIVAPNAGDDKITAKPETVTFTVKCKYTPPSPQPKQPNAINAVASSSSAPANQVAQR